jgi:hypothetical protein
VPGNYTISAAAVAADFTDNPTHPGSITVEAPRLVASGFNGDGFSDVLFQNSSGEAVIWEMNGTSVIGSGSLGNPGRPRTRSAPATSTAAAAPTSFGRIRARSRDLGNERRQHRRCHYRQPRPHLARPRPPAI